MRLQILDPLTVPQAGLRHHAMVGVGGIGSGAFFAVSGNTTLGREESRGGRFLDRRDYCKLHIISHYVRALLGEAFSCYPVGKIGDDDSGRGLRAEMDEAGLDLRHVSTSPGHSTLFSFCIVYPDGSGGNLTTEDSACSKVDPEYVAQAEPELAHLQGRCVALAVPEAPMSAREALLKLGRKHGALCVASFASEEIRAAVESGWLRYVDLLAMNSDEAAAAARVDPTMQPDRIAAAAIEALASVQPRLFISVTAGASGSWVWDGESLHQAPAVKTEVMGTAGAGDAHLSGMLAGLSCGLPLAEAQQLGALVAGLSVTSPHTIHKGICRDSLLEFAIQCGVTLPESMRALLRPASGGV